MRIKRHNQVNGVALRLALKQSFGQLENGINLRDSFVSRLLSWSHTLASFNKVLWKVVANRNINTSISTIVRENREL